jgi:SPP1 gp7 family putative phage head morphogenesis protein
MKKVKAYVSFDKDEYFKEEFKSEVTQSPIKFPTELGEEHPFNMEDVEKAFKKIGIVNGLINKIADNIVGEFSIKCKNKKALIIINYFIHDTAFKSVIKSWVVEGLAKGNGYLELDLKQNKVKVVNAKSIYIVQDKKGNVLRYNQFSGDLNKFSLNSRKLISFKPNEIAHLKINSIPGEPYGYGLIVPNEKVIEGLIINETDKQKLLSRKAGVPIHVQVGQPGESVDNSVVDDINNKLKYMTNRTEWVTDGNVKMSVLNFGDVGKNLSDSYDQSIEKLSTGFQVPVVLFGKSNVAEGLANSQTETFLRMINSIQDEVESIIEEKIFKPILIENKLDADIDFIWNLPGDEQINQRLMQLNSLLNNPYIADGLRKEMQLEIARLLDVENPEQAVNTENTQGPFSNNNNNNNNNNEVEKEKEEEKEIEQPEVPGEKEKSNLEIKEIKEEIPTISKEELYLNMPVKEFVSLVEIKGFNYSDYLIKILKRLKVDEFTTLKAITESDLENGLLNSNDIEKLRSILKSGFKGNWTMRQIENEIKDNLNLRDRISENGQIIPKEIRPTMISRTETVRLSNSGLLDVYKENKIEKVRWLAALSDRTCNICESKNGEVLDLTEAYNEIPAHPGCRCSWLSV